MSLEFFRCLLLTDQLFEILSAYLLYLHAWTAFSVYKRDRKSSAKAIAPRRSYRSFPLQARHDSTDISSVRASCHSHKILLRTHDPLPVLPAVLEVSYCFGSIFGIIIITVVPMPNERSFAFGKATGTRASPDPGITPLKRRIPDIAFRMVGQRQPTTGPYRLSGTRPLRENPSSSSFSSISINNASTSL